MTDAQAGTAPGKHLPPIAPAIPARAGSDLIAAAFILLRRTFFDPQGRPIPFELRLKRNTQDDPFDEYVAQMIGKGLVDAVCQKSPGALTTPDIVLLRPDLCHRTPKAELRNNLSKIVGIEVKKLERTGSGVVARASGMDYNTTPPCGTVAVYDAHDTLLPIRGFYLFICLEAVAGTNNCQTTALLLADGDLLNADYEYYLSITGTRKKSIGIGTYGDGANRNRPMLIFANPLGCKDFDKKVTLIHPRPDLHNDFNELKPIGTVQRTIPSQGIATFYVYRCAGDVSAAEPSLNLLDPFHTPARSEDTSGRGKFRVAVRPTP